jgi:hypothetical protein
MTYRNGGISVRIGTYDINTITGYSVSTHKNSKGGSPAAYRDIEITSGIMAASTARGIQSIAVSGVSVSVSCPDISGTMYITGISQELVNANRSGNHCRLRISLSEDPESGDLTQTVTVNIGSSVVCATITGTWSGDGEFGLSGETPEIDAGTATDIMGTFSTEAVSVNCAYYTGNMFFTSLSSSFQSNGKYRVSFSLSTKRPDNAVTIQGIGGGQTLIGLSSFERGYSYESESFEMYDLSTRYIYKGRRLTISYTTVPLEAATANSMLSEFATPSQISVDGLSNVWMAVDSCSKSAVAKGGATLFTFSVQLTALTLESGGGTYPT